MATFAALKQRLQRVYPAICLGVGLVTLAAGQVLGFHAYKVIGAVA